jgi:hypothetical protein
MVESSDAYSWLKAIEARSRFAIAIDTKSCLVIGAVTFMAAKSIETAFIAFGIVDTATIRDIVGKLELAAVTTIRT